MFYKSMEISDMCHSIITSDKEFVCVHGKLEKFE